MLITGMDDPRQAASQLHRLQQSESVVAGMDDPRQAALQQAEQTIQLLRSHGFLDSQIFSLFAGKPASQADKPASQETACVTTPDRADSRCAVVEGDFVTPTKAARTKSVVSPGSSPRPVSWSLHKYFTSARPGPEQTALVPALKPRGNSELARQAEEQAQENRQAVLDQLPGSARALCQQKTASRPYQRQKGGRTKRAPEAPKEHRIVASAARKHEWCQWIYAQTAKGRSLKSCYRQVAHDTGAGCSSIRLWWQQRDRWATWVSEHPEEGRFGRRRQGCWVSLKKIKQTSTGKRISQNPNTRLGRPQPCAPFIRQVEVFASQEEAAGHSLARQDLFREFSRLLEEALVEAKQAEEAGTVTPELQKDIAAWRAKAVSLKNRKKRDDWAKYLVVQTDWTEKKTNRTTPLSQEEENRRMQAGWMWWDFMIWLAGCADSTALLRWVAQAEQFVLSRGETVLTFSDQIPIWLCPQAGKVLVRQRVVHQAAAYRRAKKFAKKAGMPPPASQPKSHVRGPGTAQAARWRVSLVARQAIVGWFSGSADEPEGP